MARPSDFRQTKMQGPCPRRVFLAMSALLPLYPRKPTFIVRDGMSQRCQEETHAPQQTTSLFDLLIGDGDERLRYREAEISPQYSIGTARRWAHGQQSHLSHCTIVPN